MPWWVVVLLCIFGGVLGFVWLLSFVLRDFENDKEEWYRKIKKKENKINE